ncbi:MAG TPA: hypothetical protein VFG69_04610 [Nannocystaceae bacterium]|nr:hypothetical protein [Nannocystaceae bacterium]
MIARADHDAPYWCEENVWHLCADPRVRDGVAEVAVVTNADRRVALLHQRASPRPDGLVVWDYHVLLCSQTDEGWLAWDLDTTLGWPLAAGDYLARTFPPALDPSWQPSFRIVVRDAYVRDFASDRSHMRGPDGAWLQPPPPWPAIGRGHSLPRLLDLADASAGPWLDLGAVCRRWT